MWSVYRPFTVWNYACEQLFDFLAKVEVSLGRCKSGQGAWWEGWNGGCLGCTTVDEEEWCVPLLCDQGQTCDAAVAVFVGPWFSAATMFCAGLPSGGTLGMRINLWAQPAEIFPRHFDATPFRLPDAGRSS